MINPKKIHVLTPNLKVGGSQRFIVNLVNGLNPSQFSVTLIVCSGTNSFFTINDSVTTVFLKKKSVKQSFFSIISYCRKTQPDIIFSNQAHLNWIVILTKPFLTSSSKFICRQSNIASVRVQKSISSKVSNLLIQLLYPKYDLVICQSSDMKKDLIENYKLNEKSCEVIHNPIDIEKIYTLANQDQERSEGFHIIAVGSQLGKHKGFERFIKSLTVIKETKFKCAILGEGSNRINLQELIDDLQLQNNVFLVGLKPNPYSYFKNAVVYGMSSFSEGFPNVLLEAGIFGLTSICFDAPGGTSDIITDGKNGFIVPSDNIEAYQNKLIESLKKPLARDVIIEMTKEKFSSQLIINQYSSVLINL